MGSISSGGLSGQVFGGGPILGVASTSKEATIREFNNKNHYNDWLFIYDPTNDRGGLLNSPWQQNAMAGMGGGMQPGMPIPGMPGQGMPNRGTTPQPQSGGGSPNPQPMPPEQ